MVKPKSTSSRRTDRHTSGPSNLDAEAGHLQAVAELFNVLSEPTRLHILKALQVGPLTVMELMQQTGLRQANASKQLGILYQAGLLDRAKDGNLVRYSIRMPLVFKLCDLVCNELHRDAQERLKILETASPPLARSRR